MELFIDKEKLKQIKESRSSEKTHTILIVDDERENAESLAMILEDNYEIIKTGSADQALDYIQTDPDPGKISLIISDQRMPGMTGVEFLRETIFIIPNAIRILITGFADIKDIIDSINIGQIYKYITKPVEPKELLVTVKRALEAYDMNQKNRELIMELKRVNESLERIVEERTRQLQESLEELRKQKQELEYFTEFQDKLVNELQELSLTDPLTGISNRRTMEAFAETEFGRAARNRTQISFMMIDIDHFKLYNDHYGHAMGDKCIKNIAGILTDSLKRSADSAARYGGEEFCCILPETDTVGALKVAEEIISRLCSLRIVHEKSLTSMYVTVSIGIFSVIPGQGDFWKDALSKADEQLYSAKKNGRNRIEYSK
ncbi:MAG TPA: diguanylate cyclase [Leptospiraceae bacterium]|nr:diguanylate cyclase [Leptospiraceae bacterium]